MKIEIEFDILKETKMSADDFTYLYIVYRKGFTLLNDLNLKPDLEKLQLFIARIILVTLVYWSNFYVHLQYHLCIGGTKEVPRQTLGVLHIQ